MTKSIWYRRLSPSVARLLRVPGPHTRPAARRCRSTCPHHCLTTRAPVLAPPLLVPQARPPAARCQLVEPLVQIGGLVAGGPLGRLGVIGSPALHLDGQLYQVGAGALALRALFGAVGADSFIASQLLGPVGPAALVNNPLL